MPIDPKYTTGPIVTNCPSCGNPVHAGQPHEFCAKCGKNLGSQVMQQLRHVRDPRSGEMKRIQLTTAQTLEGFRVKQTIEIVSAECVLGMSAFSDMFSGFRDLAGGRSKSYQRHL